MVEQHSGDDALEDISWAAYHAIRKDQHDYMEGISSLLPLFTESSKSAAMMYHSMNIGKQAVHHLNPGQVPFITVDQPLFALAKKIQWNFPDVFGEDKFVVLLGGLHIEMEVL